MSYKLPDKMEVEAALDREWAKLKVVVQSVEPATTPGVVNNVVFRIEGALKWFKEQLA
ncbi:MAG: hypothetical protein M0P95_17880 [Sulfuritalea sp.]|nr:hypothetical protein [Sulfuritalea sp.]